MTKYASAFALLLCLFCLSSCGSSNGCRGGGWYGDRNLTEVSPELPDQVEIKEISEACD